MTIIIKLLFVAMILAALYGLLLLCVAILFVLWKEWRKLWEEKENRPQLRGGLSLIHDLLQNIHQIVHAVDRDIAGQNLIFEINGQRLKLGA